MENLINSCFFGFDTVFFLLAEIRASVKSYFAALFAFRVNDLISFTQLSRGFLPLLLIRVDSFLLFLESVVIQNERNKMFIYSFAVERCFILVSLAFALRCYHRTRTLVDPLPTASFLSNSFHFSEVKLVPLHHPKDPQ